MSLMFVLTAIMSSFMLFFVIDISYNLRRLNNTIKEVLDKQKK
ncbi:MAG: hypothetical protein PHR84_04205 [Candidatus Omnitrophica bacterium]|nr:hypothetical protein [Candidatus Omnitrophota bacterium]MDD5660316.1 hypothetical protein [Candidatus Omnitrophota bacterium]